MHARSFPCLQALLGVGAVPHGTVEQVPGCLGFSPNNPALFSLATFLLIGPWPAPGYLPSFGIPSPIPSTQV